MRFALVPSLALSVPLALAGIALTASAAVPQDLKLPKRNAPVESGRSTPAAKQDDPAPAVTAEVEASRLVGSLAQLKDAGSEDSPRFVAQLVALGDAGRNAARAGLGLDGLAVLDGCLRVLCATGADDDRRAVLERLSRSLPKGSQAVLLRTLAEQRGDWLDAQALADLLDHRQSAMRLAAERQLRTALEEGEMEWEEVRSALDGALASKRSSTVECALEVLASRSEGVEWELFYELLGDSRSQVSSAASRLLAERPEPALDGMLLERAFRTEHLFRDQAMALVAVLEREDLSGRRLLDESRVPGLLKNLRRRDSAMANAISAVALTRIGFQMGDRSASAWYEREVPNVLVAELGGLRFHKDYSVTKPLCIGALQQWSGQRFGEDGPAWMAWWRAGDNDYRGRRAALDVSEADAGKLTVFVSDRLRGTAYGFVGPQADPPAAVFGELFHLDASRSSEMFKGLAQTGIFGAERIPPSVNTDKFDLLLEVAVGDQRKRFTFPGEAPAWTTPIFEASDRTAAELSWQGLYDPRRFADRRQFVEAEGPWWWAEHTEAERGERRAELLLTALSTARGTERAEFTGLLVEHRLRTGAVAGSFGDYMRAVEGAPFYRNSTTDLVNLTVVAGLSDSQGENPEPQALALTKARPLFELLYASFRETGWPGMHAVLESADLELARELSKDSRALVRALAAGRLANSKNAADVERLRRLLFDEDTRVESAAVEAVAQADAETYRNELLVRAQFGSIDVREAALLACGRLAGPEARAVQIEAMATTEVRLQVAAMRGIALSGDPDAASILVRQLGKQNESPLSLAAEAALLTLGENAVGELSLLASSPRAQGRRDAAVLLAKLGRSEAAEPLIDLLTFAPRDSELSFELAVLTGIDLREEFEPARAWNSWWRNNASQTTLNWFRAGQARAGLAMAPPGSLEGAGTLPGAVSLHETLASDAPHLAERALRELRRLLDFDLGELPAPGQPRELWRAELLNTIERAYAAR